ncbi:MAG: DUF6898 family protein [Pseudomonadota bacterium]
MSDGSDQKFLIEFVRIGASVKVSAIDPMTGVEVSIIGPAHLSEAQLSKNAINKLLFVLAKKGKKTGKADINKPGGLL